MVRTSRLFLIALVPSALCVIAGCPTNTTTGGGTEPLTAVLPSSITLDISELPEDADDEAAQSQLTRNIYDRVLRSSSSVVHRFQYWADRALALGSTIHNDITDVTQSTVTGTITINQEEVAYKADFSAFDFDGNGVVDGSGNAVQLPIALRVWVDRGSGYGRFLCALITEKPSDDDFGAAEVYVSPYALNKLAPAGVQMFIQYDRTGEAHRWNQAYVSGTIHPKHRLDVGLVRVDVREEATGEGEVEAATLSKTVRSACNFTDSLYGFDTLQSAVNYEIPGAAIVASAYSTGGIVNVDFEEVCVDLSAFTVAESGGCDALDTQDMTYLTVPTGDETEFPAAFPETPTF